MTDYSKTKIYKIESHLGDKIYVGLYSALMAFVLAICAQFYRSKCKEVDICCINVKGEEELDKIPQNLIAQNNL